MTCTRETRNACKILAEKPEGNRSLGRWRHRWENIKLDVEEIRWKGVVWICLTKIQFVGGLCNVFSVSINCRDFLDQLRNY